MCKKKIRSYRGWKDGATRNRALAGALGSLQEAQRIVDQLQEVIASQTVIIHRYENLQAAATPIAVATLPGVIVNGVLRSVPSWQVRADINFN
jgi:hypothetical protein